MGNNLSHSLVGDYGFRDESDRLLSLVRLQLSTVAVAPAASAIDWSLSNSFSKSIAGNTTFTFTNTTEKEIVVVVASSGAYTVTWPAGIKWPAGSAPVQTSSGTDVYRFVKQGSVFYGYRAAAAVA
jgi:hypothetical protein